MGPAKIAIRTNYGSTSQLPTPMSEQEQLDALVAEIARTTPNGRFLPRAVLRRWARLVAEGKWESREQMPDELVREGPAPEDLSSASSEDLSAESDPLAEEEDEDEYGDIVTVKNQAFVVCSGLVVPQDLLKDTIVPMINEEMKRLGIDVDDVYSALMDQ